MTAHSALTGAELHEPKGVATANDGEVYVADGAGSGAWGKYLSHGDWAYNNIGTGTTFSTPTSYTLMNVVGTTGHVEEFTHNALGRLTYTGTPDKHVTCQAVVTFKHSTGSGQDCYFAGYKNGSIIQTGGTVDLEAVVTADSANYQHASLVFDTNMSTNDYIEVYLKVATGDIIVHAVQMAAWGHL